MNSSRPSSRYPAEARLIVSERSRDRPHVRDDAEVLIDHRGELDVSITSRAARYAAVEVLGLSSIAALPVPDCHARCSRRRRAPGHQRLGRARATAVRQSTPAAKSPSSKYRRPMRRRIADASGACAAPAADRERSRIDVAPARDDRRPPRARPPPSVRRRASYPATLRPPKTLMSRRPKPPSWWRHGLHRASSLRKVTRRASESTEPTVVARRDHVAREVLDLEGDVSRHM